MEAREPPPPPPPDPKAPSKVYGTTTGQPYVWSPGEKEAMARTREGTPNPWREAEDVAHVQALAREIRRQWRDELHRDDGLLLRWLARAAEGKERERPFAGAAEMKSLDQLERLGGAALRSLKERLREIAGG